MCPILSYQNIATLTPVYLHLIFEISIIQQRNKYITKNIYFIQEKSVDINKIVKCKIVSEIVDWLTYTYTYRVMTMTMK